jgi:hypothetical protein
MAKLPISHHERVGGHPHRWRVHLHGRSEPIVCELPAEERAKLDISDEEIHELLPTALQRRHEENREDVLPEPSDPDVGLDSPVRLYQTHFMA